MSEPGGVAPALWTVESDELHADCAVFEVRRLTCRHPVREAPADFFALDLRDWAVVFALTPERELVLVQQFRFGIQALTWELPAGCVDAGESPLAAAERELLEETGFAGTRVQDLGWVHPNPALQNNRCHFVLVEGAQPVAQPQWDAHEDIRVATQSVDRVLELALGGTLSHAIVHAGLLRFLRWDKG